MPSLKLIRRPKDQPIPDEYGFRAGFRNARVGALIAAYNSGVGSRAWTRARGEYLVALREALLATGLDCSSFISGDGMSIDEAVQRKGRKIVPIERERARIHDSSPNDMHVIQTDAVHGFRTALGLSISHAIRRGGRNGVA